MITFKVVIIINANDFEVSGIVVYIFFCLFYGRKASVVGTFMKRNRDCRLSVTDNKFVSVALVQVV